jgi:outer membrane protein OmpA-like peptidoglycan-associated protein
MFKRFTKISAYLACAALVVGCATNPSGPDYDKGGAKKAVTVTQTERGAMITSDERILFDIGKTEITSNGTIFIERVAKILKEKTTASVQIDGHADNQGSADLNQRLSDQRAIAVKTALVAQGVNKNRIATKGLGFSKPVASNATAEGRQSNRRTEIIVLGESAEKIGGQTLADNLAEGLDRFLKNAGQFLQNVFGGDSKTNQK